MKSKSKLCLFQLLTNHFVLLAECTAIFNYHQEVIKVLLGKLCNLYSSRTSILDPGTSTSKLELVWLLVLGFGKDILHHEVKKRVTGVSVFDPV